MALLCKHTGLAHPLRSLSQPTLRSGLDCRPPAWSWEMHVEGKPGIRCLGAPGSMDGLPTYQRWREGREPHWWAELRARPPPKPAPPTLTPEMKAQVDGVLGQLRAVMAKNKNRIIDTFLAFDANNSGTIDRNEFREAVLTLGVVAHKAALDALFDRIDADRGGSIDYRELDRQLGIRTQAEYSWSVARNNRPVAPGLRPFSASTSSLHRDYEQTMADRVASVRKLRAQSAGRRPVTAFERRLRVLVVRQTQESMSQAMLATQRKERLTGVSNGSSADLLFGPR